MNAKVKIFKDKIEISHNGTSKSYTPKTSFTTKRLLIGNFLPAVECLKRGLKEAGIVGFFRLVRPSLDIYPMEMTEGGLSEVEIRVFREVAAGAGAKDAKVHV